MEWLSGRKIIRDSQPLLKVQTWTTALQLIRKELKDTRGEVICFGFSVGTDKWCVTTLPPTFPQGTKSLQRVSSIDRREWMSCAVGYLHYLKAKSHVFLERMTNFFIWPFTFHATLTFSKLKCVVKCCHFSGKEIALWSFQQCIGWSHEEGTRISLPECQ